MNESLLQLVETRRSHDVVRALESMLKQRVYEAIADFRLEVADAIYTPLSEMSPEGQKEKDPGQNFAEKRKTLIGHIKRQTKRIRTLRAQMNNGTSNASTMSLIRAARAMQQAHRAELNALEKRGQ